MRVRPLAESAERFLKNSMRAYLEGQQNLRWIVGIIGSADAQVQHGLAIFNSLAGYGLEHRRVELGIWFRERLSVATNSEGLRQ